MKFGYILAGLLFLANPNIGIVDIVPDFIGYILIIKGISLSHLFIPIMADAERGMWKMFIISVLKSLLSFVLLLNINTMPLLLSFSFAVVEIIFLLPAINAMFEGISHSVMRYGASSAVKIKRKKKIVHNPVTGQREMMEVEVDAGIKAKTATIVFLIYRTVLSIVPTLTDLQLSESPGDVEEYYVRFADFNNVISLLVFAVCLIGSVIWLCLLIPYMTKMIRSKDLAKGFDVVYRTEIDSDPRVRLGIDFKKIVILIGGAIVSYNSLILDGINFLPNIIAVCFAVSAAVCLSKYIKKTLFLIAPAILSGIISVFQLITQIQYFSILDYVPEDSLWKSAAGSTYGRLKLFSFAENLLMLAVLLILLFAVYFCWKNDCKKNDILLKPDSFVLEYRSKLKGKFIFALIFTTVLCILWSTYPILVLYFQFTSTLMMLATFAWTGYLIFLISDIYSGVYKKYLTKE